MPALATGVGAEGQGQEGELSVLHVCCWGGLGNWFVEEVICCELSKNESDSEATCRLLEK
jgi:hypothetical protein